MSAGVSFGLSVEEIEDMTPLMLARAIRAAADREQQAFAAVAGAMFGKRGAGVRT